MSNLTVKGNASGTGTVILEAPNTNSNRTITLPDATATLASTAYVDSSVATAARMVAGTAVSSTSGTSIDFTGIPSWAKRVTVMLNGVSLSGTSDILVQLGTSGGFVTSGYASSGIFLSTNGAGRTATTGYLVYLSLATRVFTGTMMIANITGNTWVESTTGSDESTNAIVGGGKLALSGTLDRIRITTLNGTDTFDAGTINIMWEG